MRRKEVALTWCNYTLTPGLSWQTSVREVVLHRTPLWGTGLQILRIIAGQISLGDGRKGLGLKTPEKHPGTSNHLQPHLTPTAASHSRMR